MTLKELKEEFLVYPYEGTYLLCSLTEHDKRDPHKYLCSVTKKGKKFFVEGFEPTGNMDTLKEQINQYVKSLPYDSNYYFPRWRKGVFVERIISDYLQDTLGFKWESGFGGDLFVLKQTNVYGGISSEIILSFTGLVQRGDVLDSEVKVFLYVTESSYISTTVPREVEAIKGAINKLLKPLLVSDSVTNLQLAQKIPTDADTEIELIMTRVKGLNISQSSYKEALKEMLLEMANSL